MKVNIISFSLMAVATLMAGGCSGADSSAHHHEEEEDHHESHQETLILSQTQMNTVGIELGGIERKEIGAAMRVNGTVEVDPRFTADVSVMFPGIVKFLRVAEGDFVSRGSVVATVESMEVMEFQSNLRDARLALEQAEREKARQEALASQGAGIKKNLENAVTECNMAKAKVSALENRIQSAGASCDGSLSGLCTVTASVSGVVNKIDCKTGSYADPSMPLMSITDNSKAFVLLRVFERDIEKVVPGQAVDMLLTNGDGSLQGVVESVNPTIDSSSKTIGVRVKIVEKRSLLVLPGMAVNAYISSGSEAADVIPEEAVVSEGGKSFIYVLSGEESHDGEKWFEFTPVEVVVGIRQLGFVEITPLTPVRPDQSIVIKKAFYIASMAADHGDHD